ncbi:hypothetical protein YC2023_011491 [Brassica napus]
MTKKGNPLGNPPAASSSDDDDDEADSSAGDEEEVNDSSSEEEEEENQPKPPSSSAKTDSESDTKKEKSPPPATKSGTKWPSEGISKETNSKRAKKDDEKKIGEDSKKPAAFQRLWTEEDEIAVLQGMIDFKKDTGNSPYDDTNAYYDYIKKSISFEVKLSFASSPNGKTVDDGGDKRVSVRGGDEKYDWFEKSFLVRGIAGFGVDESYVKQRWRLVPIETKKKVEEKVKMLQAKEIEFVLQKTEI